MAEAWPGSSPTASRFMPAHSKSGRLLRMPACHVGQDFVAINRHSSIMARHETCSAWLYQSGNRFISSERTRSNQYRADPVLDGRPPPWLRRRMLPGYNRKNDIGMVVTSWTESRISAPLPRSSLNRTTCLGLACADRTGKCGRHRQSADPGDLKACFSESDKANQKTIIHRLPLDLLKKNLFYCETSNRLVWNYLHDLTPVLNSCSLVFKIIMKPVIQIGDPNRYDIQIG